MRYLLLGVVLVSFASASIAEGAREKNLRQYVGDSSKAARIARLGGAFSSPCSCSAGTPLQGRGGGLQLLLRHHAVCGGSLRHWQRHAKRGLPLIPGFQERMYTVRCWPGRM